MRLRAPGREDLDDLKAFYERLSPESRYLRVHGFGRTDAAAADYANADGVDRAALIGRHGDRAVAAAGYDVLREPGAEVAFAVADDFQGRGAATRLLEQLAAIAAERGIQRFDAEVMEGNRGMLTVFERAGFDVRRKGAYGEVTVSLDISPDEAVLERRGGAHRRARPPRRGGLAATDPRPRLARGRGRVEQPWRGGSSEHPRRRVPGGGHARRPGRRGRARGVQPGRAGGTAELEQRVLEIVRGAGLRMVGPNCLGVLNTDPAVSLNATFAGATVPAGRLAICSQSGALGLGLLGHAAGRRLGVSSFASLGNRADVSTNDLIEL